MPLMQHLIFKRRECFGKIQKGAVKGSVLNFDGTPFHINSLVALNCRHGSDRNAARKAKRTAQETSDETKVC